MRPMMILDDRNADQFAGEYRREWGHESGCAPRRLGYGEVAGALPAEEAVRPIPRSEWSERIKARQNSRLSDLLRSHRVPAYYQNGLRYCHSYAGALLLTTLDLVQTCKVVLYSPETLGGPITGYRNMGAGGDQVLARLRDYGIAEARYAPPRDYTPSDWQAGWEENARLHRILEWFDVGESSRATQFEMQATLLLMGIPLWIGLRWWSHAVAGLDLVEIAPGRFGIEVRNSHGLDPEGQEGQTQYLILDESRATADLGCFAPRLATIPGDVGPK